MYTLWRVCIWKYHKWFDVYEKVLVVKDQFPHDKRQIDRSICFRGHEPRWSFSWIMNTLKKRIVLQDGSTDKCMFQKLHSTDTPLQDYNIHVRAGVTFDGRVKPHRVTSKWHIYHKSNAASIIQPLCCRVAYWHIIRTKGICLSLRNEYQQCA